VQELQHGGSIIDWKPCSWVEVKVVAMTLVELLVTNVSVNVPVVVAVVSWLDDSKALNRDATQNWNSLVSVELKPENIS
jgi:hypothetical protein